ncbi:MAG: glycosyltransferase family 4 protein [Methanosarcinaceae archaeon]
MGNNFVIIAGEEAGPKSNKMGGIWNVINAEAHTLASLFDSGALKEEEKPQILIAGPYYGHWGADWNRGLNRITDMGGLNSLSVDGKLLKSLEAFENAGINVFTGEKQIGKTKLVYLQFQTDNFGIIRTVHKKQEMTLENKVKAEAFEFIGLDSMKYESMGNGAEYTHYLNLSYAISEFVRTLVIPTPQTGTEGEKGGGVKGEEIEKIIKKGVDAWKAVSMESALPCPRVSLHCHEFGTFYAPARLKKLGIPVSTIATLHATLPGRAAGHNSIQKIRNNDSIWSSGVPGNLAALEVLAAYADTVTAVGESTRQEAKLFYGIDGIVVRNGIRIETDKIDWDRKERCLGNLQNFLSEKLYRHYDGERINPEKFIPIFTISRIEIENKGYPDLLDSLLALEHIIKNSILEGHMEEGMKVICFLVTAEGPKTNLPEDFPVHISKEILVGNELKIQQMIEERELDCSGLVRGKRSVAAILYPQIISADDGGLCMGVEDFMAGCCAGIFPSRYDPFLLTGLEAGREATPSVVSRVCGFSDAVKTNESLVEGLGGVIVVDNIDLSYYEAVLDYALAASYFIRNFVDDRVKYKLLCREAFLLAKDMGWEKPTEHYYELISGVRICGEK